MYMRVVLFAILSVSVLGSQFYQNVEHDFGAMLARGEAMLEKRQGYYPTTRRCGQGKTCAEACGPGTEQCPSSKNGLYCHEPASSRCCTDGSGNACRIGYFCTTDGKATPSTYCCPDGMDLGTCARAYSLTISLVRASSTFVSSSSTRISSSARISSSTQISASLSRSTTVATSSAVPPPPVISTSVAPTSIVLPTASGTRSPPANGTVTTTPPVQFTNAAAKLKGAGMAALAGLAGLL